MLLGAPGLTTRNKKLLGEIPGCRDFLSENDGPTRVEMLEPRVACLVCNVQKRRLRGYPVDMEYLGPMVKG